MRNQTIAAIVIAVAETSGVAAEEKVDDLCDLPLDGLSLLPHMKGERPPSAEARGTAIKDHVL